MCNSKSVVYLFTDNRNTKTKIMTTELKNALELIRDNCSREEIIKHFFTNKFGNIDLSKLDFRGLTVFLEELKAYKIFNIYQQAEFIFNYHQKANSVNNKWQQAKYIDNEQQQAEEIDNKGQTILKTTDPNEKWNCLTDEQKQELIKKLTIKN